MPNLTFFRQQRVDGGVRTGIDIDGYTALHRFESGKGESDPALLWWVELRCQGAKLPSDPEEARQWFLENASVMHRGLQTFAAEIEVGMDINFWPLLWTVPRPPRGVRITIACSAQRRVEAREMASIVSNIDRHLEDHVQSLLGHEAHAH